MMIGTVYGEFATFAPAAYDKNKLTAEEILEILKKVYGDNAEKVLDAFKEAYPEKNGVDVLAIDRAMREPTVKLAKLFAKGGGKAYLYNFALEFPFHTQAGMALLRYPIFFGNADLVEIVASRMSAINWKAKSSEHFSPSQRTAPRIMPDSRTGRK